MADLKDFVGKRILVKKPGSEDVFETEIAEVSPSGKYIRVGGGNWVSAEQYDIVEELPRSEPSQQGPTVKDVEETYDCSPD